MRDKLLKNIKSRKTSIVSLVTFLLLLALVFVIFFQKVEFSASDLGRHLENGRLLFSEGGLLSTNFYSYTEPGHSFINHHWLAGLVYYQVYSLGGFKLLSIFNILLALGVFTLFFLLAKRRSSFAATALLSLPVIFLMSSRVEPRPELFSYLFLGLTWLVLESGKVSDKKRLLILLPLFTIWANTHIYFFMGLALVFFYVIDGLVGEGVFPVKFNKLGIKVFWHRSRQLILSFLGLVLVCAISPNHFKGLLYPLNILRKYGYEIAENKSIFFLSSLSPNPNYLFFTLLLVLLVLAILANYLLDKKRSYLDLLLAIFISVLALRYSRNLALFALVALVIIAPSLKYTLDVLSKRLDYVLRDRWLLTYWRIVLRYLYLLVLISSLMYLIADSGKGQVFIHNDAGLGLSEASLNVFDYYRSEGLVGPVYNNYDSGSALIFGLADKEKVFVDNRPEAYSVEFFKDTYVPMQEDRSLWESKLEEYKFKTIIFTHTDSTPWAKNFVVNILQDEDWSLVYFDYYYLVLLNKNAYSEEFIDKEGRTQVDFVNRVRSLADEGSLKSRFSIANFCQLAGYDYLAKEIYQKILLEYPNKQRVLFALGGLYGRTDSISDLNQAISYYRQGQKAGLKVANVDRETALVYWRLNNYEQAEKYFKKAAKGGDANSKDYIKQIKELRERKLLP